MLLPVLPISSDIVSVWFVRCEGEAANMRPVDCVGSASLDDAACRRFNTIREQTIPCATRVTTERILLRGDYTESGIGFRRPEGCMNIFFTCVNRRERIGNSDEAKPVVQHRTHGWIGTYQVKQERRRRLREALVKCIFSERVSVNVLTVTVDHPEKRST